MRKKEFLYELRQRLSSIPEEELERTVSFYEESIEDRMEDGMTEEDAVSSMESMDAIVGRVLSEFVSQGQRNDSFIPNSGQQGRNSWVDSEGSWRTQTDNIQNNESINKGIISQDNGQDEVQHSVLEERNPVQKAVQREGQNQAQDSTQTYANTNAYNGGQDQAQDSTQTYANTNAYNEGQNHAQRNTQYQGQNTSNGFTYKEEKRRFETWQIVLIVVTSPIWLSVLIGAVSGAFGLLMGVFGVVIGLVAGTVGLVIGGVTALISSVPVFMSFGIGCGLATLGVGLFCLGLGILLFLAGITLGKLVGKLFRKLVDWLRGRRTGREGGKAI